MIDRSPNQLLFLDEKHILNCTGCSVSSRTININYVGECISNVPCLQHMRKATEKSHQASKSPGQELKLGLSKYKAEVLTTH